MSIIEQYNIQNAINYNQIFVDFITSILNGETLLSRTYNPQKDWNWFIYYKDWKPGDIDGNFWQWFSSPSNTSFTELNSTGKAQVAFGAALFAIVRPFTEDELYSK